MDDEALSAAVIANPAAIEPRIALATKVGGPREKFILGQIAASNALREGRPGASSIETDRLLAGNERAWGGPVVGRVHETRFLRGFPEWIVVDAAQFIREWQELLELAPIRHLDVANLGPVVDAFFASPGLAHIASLTTDLSGGPLHRPIGDAIVKPLLASPHLTALRYLDLEHSGLSEAANAAIAHATNLPALEVLKLDKLSEEIGHDWDGSVVDIRPSQELHDFEQRHGRSEWLHASERAGHEIKRAAI